MAIFKRKNKEGEEGDTWYVDYRDPTGKRVIKAIGPSKREAQDYLGKVKSAIRERRFFDIKKESMVSFETLINEYEEKIKDRRSYKKTTQYFIATLRDFFGPKLLAEIDYKLIEDFRDQRKKVKTVHGGERSKRSVDLELALLRTILNKGIKWDMLDRNPFDKANDLFYHPNSHRERALTEDEIKRFVEASPSYFKPILISAFYTGLRKSDLFGLKWENVDLEKGIIRVVETKTGKPRIIVLNKDMLSLLHDLPVKGEYLFPNKEGKPYSDLNGVFDSTLRKAGIDPGTGSMKVVFHTLRHSCITLLLDKGADLHMVSSYIGHGSEKQTSDYAHASEEYRRRTADLLNGVCFGNKVETTGQNEAVTA